MKDIWSKPVIIHFAVRQSLKARIYIRQVLILSLSLFLFSGISNAQPLKKFSGKSYNINEGLLSGHVLDLAEDGNGFLWISTGVGLQRFDGNTYETISAQKGLPQTSHISFFKLRDGNIWLSYENGISCYNAATNKFTTVISFSKKITDQYQPNEKLLPAGAYVTPLLETNSTVWCRDVLQKRFIYIELCF